MSTKKAGSKAAAHDRDKELIELEKELRELRLEEYTIEYPSEEAIAHTIDAMRPYVEAAAPVATSAKRKPSIPWRLHVQQIRLTYWFASLLFFGVGLLALGYWEGNPYGILLLLSPIPFLLGLLEMFRGRDEGLLELEISCKYSAQQLLMRKLFTISIYNLALCLVLIGIFGTFGEPLLLSKLIVYWAAPFTVAVSIGLAVANRVRNMLSMPIALVIWICMALIIIPSIEQFEQVAELPYIAGLIAALALVFIILQIKRLKRGYSYYEAVH